MVLHRNWLAIFANKNRIPLRTYIVSKGEFVGGGHNCVMAWLEDTGVCRLLFLGRNIVGGHEFPRVTFQYFLIFILWICQEGTGTHFTALIVVSIPFRFIVAKDVQKMARGALQEIGIHYYYYYVEGLFIDEKNGCNSSSSWVRLSSNVTLSLGIVG